MAYHAPYSVFKRTLPPKKGKARGESVYYYRLWLGENRRSPARSTGQTNKSAALDWCREKYEAGAFGATGKRIEPVTFREFASDFWDYDGRYVQGRLQRADSDRFVISRRTCFDNTSIVTNHLLPAFGDRLLAELTHSQINDWSLSIHRTEDNPDGLGGKRINDVLSVLRTILVDAYVRGLIEWDASEKRTKLEPFKPIARKRGRLTRAEANELFADENIGTAWRSQSLYRCLNMVAANTGARQGELLALRGGDFDGRRIHIQHSWDSKYGLLPTKTRDERRVRLVPRVVYSLQPFLPSDPNRFVFTLNGDRPVSGNRATDALHRALDYIKVDWKERNIGFHSWRHWLNSTLEAEGIPRAITQSMTGHRTETMTNLYTDILDEDLDPAMQVIERAIG